jgi:hypothetical protein
MTFRRVLGEIGHHPAAGVWTMAQLLLPLAYLLWLRSEPAALWGLFGVIVAMGVMQLPASVAGFWVTPLLMQLPPPHDVRALVRLLTWQWGITAILNYVIWAYAIPAFIRWSEARWPFERVYFRRPWPL